MPTVYGDRESGNCYKIYLLMHLLGIEHRWVPVNVVAGEAQRPEFLVRNPNGKVPLLEIDAGVHLAESNAIPGYLAEGTARLPRDRLLRAFVWQWMCFEQYSHEPYIATSRYYLHRPGFVGMRDQAYRPFPADDMKLSRLPEHGRG